MVDKMYPTNSSKPPLAEVFAISDRSLNSLSLGMAVMS